MSACSRPTVDEYTGICTDPEASACSTACMRLTGSFMFMSCLSEDAPDLAQRARLGHARQAADHFVERGQAAGRLVDAVFDERHQTGRFRAEASDLVGGLARDDRLLHHFVQHQQLEHANSTAVAGEAAFGTAAARCEPRAG